MSVCVRVQDNLFEWHFTLRGPDESDFVGGVYHGRIILPPEYPMKPPSIILLTVSAWIMCSPFEVLRKQLCFVVVVVVVVVLMTISVPTSSTFLTPHLLQIIKKKNHAQDTLQKKTKADRTVVSL